jgi:DUF4097 and DUF4098 domain-containing protein YvlB
MRTVLILTILTAGMAQAAGDFIEDREISLDATGIQAVQVTAGAGSLEITGVAGLNRIEVVASIAVSQRNEDKARKIIADTLVLTLERSGDNAVLTSVFNNGSWSFGDSPHVDLVVRVPSQLALRVDDGSGPVVIGNMQRDIRLEDGSGSIELSDIGGAITIKDGSGSIEVVRAGGNVAIEDGSGGITVRGVAGSVVIDDGSGGIDVTDVDQDLIIEGDGSGSLVFSDIRGRVRKDT